MELTFTQFYAYFMSAVSLYYPEELDPNLKPIDTPQTDVKSEYDFIVVGAGSAGCVMANRLTEMNNWQVLLIEAGGDEDVISDTPFLSFVLHGSEKDWNYTTVEQSKACLSTNGVCVFPRGHVMGGSSTINAMMYVRGNKADYDSWSENGNYGWSYDDVLPYFKKSENNTNAKLLDLGYHGVNGYLNVEYGKYKPPIDSKWIKAGLEFGWEEGDYNGKKQEVIGWTQYTVNGPSRESTSKAYLNPIRARKNLSIIKNAMVSKVIIDNKIARGVEYYREGKKYTVFAKKEVILSAGAINTPKLLMLSGVGPADQLQKHNIDVKANLPVGEQLQDHALVPLFLQINQNLSIPPSVWETNESILAYTRHKDGPLTTQTVDATAFMNVFNISEPPNLQLIFASSNLFALRLPVKIEPTVIILIVNVQPKSTGFVRLKSSDWRDPPLIDPKYLEEEIDIKVYQKGFKIAFDYLKTPTMQNLSPRLIKEYYSNCRLESNEISDDYVNCLIQSYTGTIYHPVGTAKMGGYGDKSAVVTPDLLVKGFKNLRIIDASVMPHIVRGNTNAATIMIAEKGADLVKSAHDWRYRVLSPLIRLYNKVMSRYFL